MLIADRIDFLKRNRWTSTNLAKEIRSFGFNISKVSVNNWINGIFQPRQESIVIVLKKILSEDLKKEGLTFEQVFNF